MAERLKRKMSTVRRQNASVAGVLLAAVLICLASSGEYPFSPVSYAATSFPKPYSPPCTEREDVFAFAEKPAVSGTDNYLCILD
jgi:hypothetical protein